MPKRLVIDKLWGQVEPLLPKHEPSKGGPSTHTGSGSFDRNHLCSQDVDSVGIPTTGDGVRQ